MKNLRYEESKARKEHKCDWCGGKILKGEKYQVQTNVFDGELYQWKEHLKCARLVKELNMSNYDNGEGISEEAFRECLQEFLYSGLTEEEFEEWYINATELEDEVDKAIEILDERSNKCSTEKL